MQLCAVITDMPWSEGDKIIKVTPDATLMMRSWPLVQ